MSLIPSPAGNKEEEAKEIKRGGGAQKKVNKGRDEREKDREIETERLYFI